MMSRTPSFEELRVLVSVISLLAGERQVEAQSLFPNGHFLDVPGAPRRLAGRHCGRARADQLQLQHVFRRDVHGQFHTNAERHPLDLA